MAKSTDTQIVDDADSKSQSQVPAGMNVPNGYGEIKDDIAGFYDPEMGTGAIHFIPGDVRLSDSSIDEDKVSALLIGELVDTCNALTDRDGNAVKAKKGETIGVWVKPGMKGLSNLAGVPVYMFQAPESEWIDTGKPNKMPVFKTFAKSKGRKLMVGQDYRKSSKEKGSLPIQMLFGTDGGV